MATDFILVRHGETVWNREGRYQGHTNIDLSERGRAQARAAGKKLKTVHLDAAYCSDLQRCRDTAALILEGRSLQAVPRPDLREAYHGLWEGMTFEDARRLYPEDYQLRETDPGRYGCTGGEALNSVQQRLWGAVQEIAAAHPDGTVLLVTHGGSVRALISKVLELDLLNSNRLAIPNAAVTIFRYSPNGDTRLIQMNDSCHLDGL
jgi:broad specificity phosphatase PhoE